MECTPAERPWLSACGDKPNKLRAARDAVAAVNFDRVLSYGDVDAASDSLAGWPIDPQVNSGERIAIVLQNDPQLLIAILTDWKVGAAGEGRSIPRATPAGDDPGLILCTSGATGEPKGATAFNGAAFGEWCGLGQEPHREDPEKCPMRPTGIASRLNIAFLAS